MWIETRECRATPLFDDISSLIKKRCGLKLAWFFTHGKFSEISSLIKKRCGLKR